MRKHILTFIFLVLEVFCGRDGSDKSSLVFVFDTTGSMYNDLKQLREGAEMILKTALEEGHVIGDFVFVPFHDPEVGPATVTTDKEAFKRALDSVRVYGGGDCPEKSLTGIQLALNVSATNSYVYVFTDATAGDHSDVGKVLDAVQRKQSQVVFVLTGHCSDLDKPSFKVYQQIAAASSGQVFNLNKTSVHKVLDFVRSSIKGKMVNLGSSVNPPGHNYTQGIPVDSTLGEVTVSVSGAKPQITVVHPSGELLTGPPKLVTTLDLSEIMVVKVLQPEPGNWTITVGSEEEYSVKVVGLSNLTFNHGFSVEKPHNMAETSYRPLKGTYNHMMISLTQTDIPVDIECAEISALNGTTLFEVPLKEIDKDNKIYMAEPFIPPEEFFYIAIRGKDQYNQELRRVGTTAVQAKSPDVPYLSAPVEISSPAHSRVVLRCRVESLVPVTAMWTKDIYKIQPKISSLQTTTIEYVIEDMTEADVGTEYLIVQVQKKAAECNWPDVGTYRCIARNVAGISTAITEVAILVEPPQVRLDPVNATLDVGQNITLTCTVFSEALLTKLHFISTTLRSIDVTKVHTEPNMEGIYSFSKTLFNVSENDSGTYQCIAANRGGSSNYSTQVKVQSKPSIQITSPHVLDVPQHTTTQLICSANNCNTVQWIAPNNSVVKEIEIKSGLVNVNLDVNVTEDGVWTCVGKRGILEASDKVEITLLLKPVVTIQGYRNITVLNGTIHEIVCEVVAKPRPDVKWVRDGNILEASFSQTSTNMFQSILKLNTSNNNVKGSYVCLAVNSVGIDDDTVTVNVRRKITVLKGLNDSSVQLYSQFEFNCLVDSDPKSFITWYHNNSILNTNTEQNIYLNDDNTTLYITKIDFNNLGTYACKATNEYESVIQNATLRVTGLEYPVLWKTPPEQTVKEGDTTVITCRVQKGNPEPTIKWQYKNITSNNFTALHSTEVETEIVIRNTSTKDAGTYRCIGENVLGYDTYDIEVVVNYAPKFKEENDSLSSPVEIRSGGTVKFSCKTTGSPPPIVTWTKDGLPVLFTDKMHVSDESSVLTISNVTEYDSGLYICNATSSIGSLQRNFTLYVYDPPKLVTPRVESPIEALEGELVELPCRAHGVPKPMIYWTHNNNLVRHDKLYDDGVGLRFIANLTDFGNYTCFAKNKYGNDSISYTLYIWVPPYIAPPIEMTKDARTGGNITLQCDVIGFPLPTVTWKFNDQVLEENTTNLSFNTLGNLFISNISINHEGMYTCIAENFAGVSNKYIYLNVNEAPKIVNDNYTGAYVATSMDNALTISCRATGKPKPIVMWLSDDHYNLNKDPRYTVEKDGSLTIKSPSEDMSSNYTCVAENSFGKVNKTVTVEIYSLPSQLQSDERHTQVTLVEQSDATIECPFRASNADTIKWYKDAKLISTGNLHISKIKRSNQTTYACVLSNAVGSAYSTVNIIVEWPPKFIADIEKDEQKHENGKNDIDNSKSDIDNGKNDKIKMNDKLEMLDEAEDLYNGLETFDNKMDTAKNEVEMIDVVKGSDAYLDCRVDAKPLAKVKWLFNAKPILFEDKDRLKLLNVQQSNAGNYKCIVSNVHGTVVKEFSLNVLVPPFISDFNVLDVVLMKGMNATLECNAIGYPEPNIRWSYNNSNWNLEDSMLTANNVTISFEGIYRCDAKNKAGTTHIVYRVSVVSSAKVLEVVAFMDGQGHGVEDKVEAKLGSNIRIACKASGKPLPIVQWVRNGKILSENSLNIDYADLILDVDASHAGGYSCIASNEGGSDRKEIKLDVLEPPRIFRSVETPSQSSNTINLEILSGQAFFLHCHPYGNPMPTVYWFKDELPLKLFDDTMVSTEFNEVIEAKSAVEDQSGNYTCVARNKVGETSVVYLVTVLVPPPTPKESSKPVHIRSGKSLNLTCPIEGSPAPYVMWVKHPYSEISNDTPRVDLLNDNVTLLINRTQVSDSGNYSCIMTNKAGTTEFVFDVSIDKPPSIAGNVGADIVENHRVAMRRSIVLKCEVEGHPRPKITWLKDTQQISGHMSNVHLVLGNSLLTLWGATSRDAGQYICIAENTAGTDSRRYNVAVIVPGKWSPWGKWSLCNATCGLGYQHKSRFCQYIDDNNITYDKTSISDKIIVDESACKGPSSEKRKCHMPPCEEDDSVSQWSPWSRWSLCSSSCGAGTQARTRRCKGRRCTGDNVQVRKCPNLPPCHSGNGIVKDKPLDSDTDDTRPDETYVPEAVFEMEPQMVGPDYTPVDADELIVPTDSSAIDTRGAEYYEVNVTSNADGSDPGPCAVGFTYDDVNTSCDDIDECLLENNSCHSTQVCVNTEGGYRCSCPAGFVSLGLGQRCLDINECTLDVSGCEYACVNVAGGYVCACPADMRLHADKHHCYTVSDLKRRYSNEDIDPEYISTSIEYPARYKRIT